MNLLCHDVLHPRNHYIDRSILPGLTGQAYPPAKGWPANVCREWKTRASRQREGMKPGLVHMSSYGLRAQVIQEKSATRYTWCGTTTAPVSSNSHGPVDTVSVLEDCQEGRAESANLMPGPENGGDSVRAEEMDGIS